MDHFTDALISKYTLKIPREYDWFAPLIGDWDITYYDEQHDIQRMVKGEWFFRRVLDGAGIEDLFICPSGDRSAEHLPVGEHGLAIRIFNAKESCYDTAYACESCMKRLRFYKEGNTLVGTLTDNSSRKWVFSEIRENSFKWNNSTLGPDGVWRVNSRVYATRKSK